MTPAEEELRDRLRGLAEQAGRPSADGAGLARRIALRSADRQRARRNLLVAVGGVILVGTAVSQLGDTGAGEAVPASGDGSVTSSAPASVLPGGGSAGRRDDGMFAGPTRGSLAGDHAFVDAVRALPWTQEPPPPAEDRMTSYLPDPPVETRSVVFAGEVSGNRWVLVVGRFADVPPDSSGLPGQDAGPGQLVAAWFTGPADARAEEMRLRSGPNAIPTDWPLAVTDPRTGALVVVAVPGDVVEVSERPEITADGSTTRAWQEVETVDGIAITRVSPSLQPYDASTSYRVLRNGRAEARDMPWSFHSDEPPVPVPVEYPRGRPSALGEQAAGLAAQHVLAELGLSPEQVEITAQWVGSVPAGDIGQGAVVTITLPSGAVVVEGLVLLPEQPGGATTGAFCGETILPAGPPAARRVQAMACEVVDHTTGAPMNTSLVVVGPPEVALIRTYAADRTFLAEHAAVGGILVAPLPLGTDTVEAVTAAGVTLGRVELLRHSVDFGD
jgi:hypothetical protein